MNIQNIISQIITTLTGIRFVRTVYGLSFWQGKPSKKYQS